MTVIVCGSDKNVVVFSEIRQSDLCQGMGNRESGVGSREGRSLFVRESGVGSRELAGRSLFLEADELEGRSLFLKAATEWLTLGWGNGDLQGCSLFK